MENKFHRFISTKMPRWFNRIYAFWGRYFWLPCPICSKNFGGHEWFSGNDIMTSDTEGEGICPKCGGKKQEAQDKINYQP